MQSLVPQEVFHRIGTFSWLRLRLNMYLTTTHSWSAQSLSSLGLIPSGPAAFLAFIFLSSHLTCYTRGGVQAQVLSNPYARARNPYEEHNVYAEPYNQPASPRAYEEQRMSPPPPPSDGAPEYRSVFPRAQIGRLY
ncbi:hypothetical protein PDJAM_G00170550 [Pangasius djambal]|uniref:Uncharacterized protein n=1 Tax=Pangasius djambal TaxID=1691987 RepID=A0ACC5ZMA6_9TELE|nr:hypothetical protein [Pangasius djambal]